ncbi:hypothetical protein N7468_005639 [Penicillium chermesinum]|uniref:Uncharacterized protein n=1 Tax=Penicillium chermesinum TaxID=63820 RepID=A0A9W9NZP2_9EURO|nr:uncharacterized protein N7468_005639 [Penicillium chermesinum]KAJ5232683.1 hypothetical protein N7468_005639 [Penicillium chermesinum]
MLDGAASWLKTKSPAADEFDFQGWTLVSKWVMILGLIRFIAGEQEFACYAPAKQNTEGLQVQLEARSRVLSSAIPLPPLVFTKPSDPGSV